MALPPGFPAFRPMAETGLMVEFGEVIAPEPHDFVLGLDRALAAAPPLGLLECVPAYTALMIRYDPLITNYAALRAEVARIIAALPPAATEAAPKVQQVDVCYEGEDFAPDLARVAQATGLSPEAVIAAHLGGDYRVFLYGFAPGYAYMAGVPEALRLPRKAAAVRGIPAGSVMIAGPQCIITTLLMPSGWAVLGRSPTKILTGGEDRPFLFEVGDRVEFRRIDRATFAAAEKAAR